MICRCVLVSLKYAMIIEVNTSPSIHRHAEAGSNAPGISRSSAYIGEVNSEGGAMTQSAFDMHLTTMGSDNMLNDA